MERTKILENPSFEEYQIRKKRKKERKQKFKQGHENRHR
jgi:hypothetical protein